MKGFHPCRWHSAANFNILLQCSLWWFRRTDYSHYIADCHLLLFWSPISSRGRDAHLLFHYFPFTFVFASLFLFHFCLQCHVGFFPIFTSTYSRFRNEERYTIAFKEISQYLFTCLPLFSNYFERSCAFDFGKCLLFFFSLFFINVASRPRVFFLSSACCAP